MTAPEFTDAPVDWSSPSWGSNPVHIATGGGVDAECAEADR